MELKYTDYTNGLWGSWRQRDLTPTVVYDKNYLQKYIEIDANVCLLVEKRLRVLETFVENRGRLLDYGAGTFRFVEAAFSAGWHALGYEIINIDHRLRCTVAIETMTWDVVTFFDSLEHLSDPVLVISSLTPRVVMVSVPWCHKPYDECWFMSWRHRKPGEHLWHWNRNSLTKMFRSLGYSEFMVSNFEDAYRPNHEQTEPNILTAIYIKV